MNDTVPMPAAVIPTLLFEHCWFEIPPERTQYFSPAFIRVAKAVQAELRRTVPQQYLIPVERFRDKNVVYPLLVYAASRPFPGKSRTDFTWDILNAALMRRFYFSVGRNLPAVLEQVHERLIAAGMDETARDFRPSLAAKIVTLVGKLKTMRRRLDTLLLGETALVNALIPFAGGHALADKDQAKLAAKCEKEWLTRLRHFYGSDDFSNLAGALVEAGSSALAQWVSTRELTEP